MECFWGQLKVVTQHLVFLHECCSLLSHQKHATHAPLTQASYHCLSFFYNGWLEYGLDAFLSQLHVAFRRSHFWGPGKLEGCLLQSGDSASPRGFQSEHGIRVGVLPLHVDQSAHMAGHVEQHLVRRTAPRHP